MASVVWTEPWDGTKAEGLLINQLEPLYIEICRRVRLRQADRGLEAVRANSLSRRIIDIKGLTGDPWAPVGKATGQRDTPPAFLGPRKFGYERIVDGLFSADWELPRLLRLTTHDGSPGGATQLIARGMVRGEGGTAGYHERVIPLTPKTAQVFGSGGNKEDIGDIARQRIAQIGKVKNILRHAIATFLARGESGDTTPEQRSLANRWVDKLDEIVDAGFFKRLQDEFDIEHADDRHSLRMNWLRNGTDGIVDHAESVLHAAEEALPCPSVHRFKAMVEADSVFWGRIRGANGFPGLFDPRDTKQEGDE